MRTALYLIGCGLLAFSPVWAACAQHFWAAPPPPEPPACQARGPLPDPACTPGAVNPAVTPDTLQSTICVRGWTATVRPPLAATERLKRIQMVEYDRPGALADYEEDHLIPLELGGAPLSADNLWPQPYAGPQGAKVKDVLEDTLRARVCAGTLPLPDAQQCIAVDWVACYQQQIGGL